MSRLHEEWSAIFVASRILPLALIADAVEFEHT